MRLIDANKAVKAIIHVRDNDLHCGYPHSFELSAIRKALRCIEETPTIEHNPVKRGKWIFSKDGLYWKCSECNVVSLEHTNYCPECGTKMDEKSKV